MTSKKQPMTFEDLQSWQEARQMTRAFYTLIRQEQLGRDFGLCGPVQRAGVSGMSNIAAGCERQPVQEKLQCYNVAHASTAEVRSMSHVIEDNYPVLAGSAIALREQASKCGRLPSGLIRSTETRKWKPRAVPIFLLLSTLGLLALAP